LHIEAHRYERKEELGNIKKGDMKKKGRRSDCFCRFFTNPLKGSGNKKKKRWRKSKGAKKKEEGGETGSDLSVSCIADFQSGVRGTEPKRSGGGSKEQNREAT